MNLLAKAIYGFNAILLNLPTKFFTELGKIISQCVWKQKRPWTVKAILRRWMELEESTFLTSDYTTKLQSSRQYGIGTKAEIQTNDFPLLSSIVILPWCFPENPCNQLHARLTIFNKMRLSWSPKRTLPGTLWGTELLMALLKQLGDHTTRPSQDFLNSPGEADKFMRWLIQDQSCLSKAIRSSVPQEYLAESFRDSKIVSFCWR